MKVGTHSVSFSGRAMVSGSDYITILAEGKDDNQITEFDCEIIVGPSWTEIYQCSFQISGGKYSNWDSDEDDWQAAMKYAGLILIGEVFGTTILE